jgi:hypothetical protein
MLRVDSVTPEPSFENHLDHSVLVAPVKLVQLQGKIDNNVPAHIGREAKPEDVK